MRFKFAIAAACLAAASCSNPEAHARRMLAQAEADCGLPRGTLKFMSINEYDRSATRTGPAKVIYVTSPGFGRFEACIDYVAKTNGYDSIRRFVTY